MSLLVQKYGGTSVGAIERIQAVADKIVKCRDQGHEMVIVVSAMIALLMDTIVLFPLVIHFLSNLVFTNLKFLPQFIFFSFYN